MRYIFRVLYLTKILQEYKYKKSSCKILCIIKSIFFYDNYSTTFLKQVIVNDIVNIFASTLHES